ncbi:hypothetical protein MMC13_003456 [Lambiella insularis]|nr:hypothetical protein [Lambiella insularis]
MVNHFRERMPRPIFGIGHSMGCAQLYEIEHYRMRVGPNAAFLSSHRPDLWPSRAGAEASFRRNKFFKDWDPRTLEKFVQFGLRETPTAVYPDSEAGAVTLTTTKHQEAWSYLRSNFTPQSNSHHEPVEHLLSPDVAPTDAIKYVFNRPECALSLLGLPYLRPSVLWVYGEHSPINVPEIRKEKMPLTGSGIGGSGGLQTGKVEEVVFEEAGHMVPMEKVKECGELMARWLEKQVEEFRTEEAFYREYDSKKSERGRLVMSKEWLQGVRRKADSKRPVKGKL